MIPLGRHCGDWLFVPKNIHINAPTRAVYKYKPPHLLPLFTNTERLKYLEAKLASPQPEENQATHFAFGEDRKRDERMD